jgi:hypothetical protein
MVENDQLHPQNEDILVDGHVHIHDCHALPVLLQSAWANFAHAAAELGLGDRLHPVLLLTESRGTDYYQWLREKALAGEPVADWHFRLTEEPDSVIAARRTGHEMTVIAGRQIVTAERLEVLAVCTAARFEEGRIISEVIEAVSRAGGIAIVPWGFSKWTGRRMRTVDRLIEDSAGRSFHLGDNAGRLALWPEPPQFRRARERGTYVLRGTDPLPFPGQEKRVGSFGFHLRGPYPRTHPASGIRKILDAGNSPPVSYGTLERPIAFVRHQLKMQAKKRRRGTAGPRP